MSQGECLLHILGALCPAEKPRAIRKKELHLEAVRMDAPKGSQKARDV